MYRLFHQDSAKLAQTDRDERLIWSIKENCFDFGNAFVTPKILIAWSNAFW